MTALEELGLSRNGITDISPLIDAISGHSLPQLKRLLLQSNALGDGMLRRLHDAIAFTKPHQRSASGSAKSSRDEDGSAVRIRGVFKSAEQPPAMWMRAAKRDAAVQTRDNDAESKLHGGGSSGTLKLNGQQKSVDA